MEGQSGRYMKERKRNVPVRPRTRVTLTSLTTTFDESMF